MNQVEKDIKSEQNRQVMIFSMILGSLFVVALLGYTAIAAEDGRMPITDWLDPMLAGLTLLSILFIQVLLVFSWRQIENDHGKVFISRMMMISQWFYIFGEVLSNTITIGEPPRDIGSLFEIVGGVLAFLALIGLLFLLSRGKKQSSTFFSKILVIVTLLLLIGMGWWFTHPIDQSKAGTPQCVPGNPIYNLFHGPC